MDALLEHRNFSYWIRRVGSIVGLKDRELAIYYIKRVIDAEISLLRKKISIYKAKQGILIQNKKLQFFMHKQSKRTPFAV